MSTCHEQPFQLNNIILYPKDKTFTQKLHETNTPLSPKPQFKSYPLSIT